MTAFELLDAKAKELRRETYFPIWACRGALLDSGFDLSAAEFCIQYGRGCYRKINSEVDLTDTDKKEIELFLGNSKGNTP